jgi:hypothetical protein
MKFFLQVIKFQGNGRHPITIYKYNFQNPGKFYAFVFQVDELALPFTRGKTKHTVAAYIYNYIVVLWRKFNCVKIPQSEANKIRESLG